MVSRTVNAFRPFPGAEEQRVCPGIQKNRRPMLWAAAPAGCHASTLPMAAAAGRRRAPTRLVADPKPTRGRPLPAGVESIAPPSAVPKMLAALPDPEVSAVPTQVTPAMSAPKATVSTAKAAMSAHASLSAPTAISSERGRRHQQDAGNRGSKREFAYHQASPTGNDQTDTH
jgi:hypothetical protein